MMTGNKESREHDIASPCHARKNEGGASEAAHSLAAECGEPALLPKRPGFAAAELPEHECGSPHVGLPYSTFHEAEDERKNRLSDQRIALAKSRLEGNSDVYLP